MDEQEFLAERFEAQRTRLRAVAYRMLGSAAEADDAVQEAWLRLNRTDAAEIESLAAWLTTVVARVSLTMLRSRETRREDPWEAERVAETPEPDETSDPERQAVLADAVGAALLVVLDTLTPAERLAFVLHDLFAVPFDEIAPIVERSPAATRQLASRARRRVRGTPGVPETDVQRQRDVVGAFLAASREGDFDALLALLDPDVTMRVDPVIAKYADAGTGAAAVAQFFQGRARKARLALINGAVGMTWAPKGKLRVVFGFTVVDGRVTAIDVVADRERIRALDVVELDADAGVAGGA